MLDRKTTLMVAKRYPAEALGYEEDVLFGDMSPMIRDRGWMKLGELVEVVYWKSRRVVGRARENDAKTVKTLTKHAFDLASRGDVELAVQTLIRDGDKGLHGVQTRMAAAILTVYDRDTYTMMDRRARASLVKQGHDVPDVYTPERYADYLELCTDLSKRIRVTLRELDRCLFVLNGRTVEDMEEQECPGCKQVDCRKSKGGGAKSEPSAD